MFFGTDKNWPLKKCTNWIYLTSQLGAILGALEAEK